MIKKVIKRRFLCLLLTVFLVFAACASGASALSIAHPHATEYDEYLKVIDQLDVPGYFVRYEHIQVLGNFEYYTGAYNDYYAYYTFVDANGYEGSLSVAQKSLLDHCETFLTVPANLSDMRSLPDSAKGTILRGPLHYIYSGGRLICIRWVLGDIEFSLGGGGMFDDYPLDTEETICSRLLSTDEKTALSAYKELMKTVPLQPGESVFSRAPYRTIAIAGLILLGTCIAAACVWLRRRRRKQSHEA